ncbi:hypothetical protein [Acholeplasma granularum]|uniref:hypothetical protein n=1 Tax=Acholeplasma granularum TaxID=264635 RepID=UPI000470700C|nr:hypothetical protein [Acholeplasma granularum]
MKIFMPTKQLYKFISWFIPFFVLSGIGIYIAYNEKNELLLNILTLFVLALILVYSIGSRIIRKDNIIITNDSISYGLKELNNEWLKIVFMNFEKNTILFINIKSYYYDETKNQLRIQWFGDDEDVINLKYFTKRTKHNILKILNERIK